VFCRGDGPRVSPAAIGEEDIFQEASGPIASLISMQLADWYTFNYHNLDGATDNAIVFRQTCPVSSACFKIFNLR
jgi:hypothetical protein